MVINQLINQSINLSKSQSNRKDNWHIGLIRELKDLTILLLHFTEEYSMVMPTIFRIRSRHCYPRYVFR